MYEFFREPARQKLMEHAAWEQQQATLLQVVNLQAKTSRPITVSHTTAANLMGVPHVGKGPVHIVSKVRGNRQYLKNAICHVWNNIDCMGAVIEVFGIMCSSPEAVFLQMSDTLDLTELVVLGDRLTCRNTMLRRATIASLTRFIKECDFLRHRMVSERALSLIRENTDSPAETRLRLMICRYGLPEPEVNHKIEINGRTFYLDLAYPQYNIGIEFNGKHHHLQSWEDWERLNSIHSTSWKIFTVESENLMLGSQRRFIADLVQYINLRGCLNIVPRDEPMTVADLCDKRRTLALLGR